MEWNKDNAVDAKEKFYQLSTLMLLLKFKDLNDLKSNMKWRE